MQGAFRQLRLLPPSKPLTERLGREFFLAVPRQPGVYRMFDAANQLIYIGQSGNLFDRLNSYRHVHPDRDSRKTVRLVHTVARIEWEVCVSPVAAVLRENELLRTLRPRFNRMNTYPQACFFIVLERTAEGLTLHLTRDTDTPGTVFGAFKAGAKFAFAALCRQLFIALHQPPNLADIPRLLLSEQCPRTQTWKCSGDLSAKVAAFLAGDDLALLQTLLNGCAALFSASRFEQEFMLGDLLRLEDFFWRSACRTKAIRQNHAAQGGWVSPEDLLDQLSVRLLQPASKPCS